MNPIEISRGGSDIVVVTLYGEHDLSTATELAEQLEQLVDAGERVVVDLSKVDYIDSSVLNNLVRANARARTHGLRLTLQIGTAAVVGRIVEITGLRDLLPIADLRDEAIRIARTSS